MSLDLPTSIKVPLLTPEPNSQPLSTLLSPLFIHYKCPFMISLSFSKGYLSVLSFSLYIHGYSAPPVPLPVFQTHRRGDLVFFFFTYHRTVIYKSELLSQMLDFYSTLEIITSSSIWCVIFGQVQMYGPVR